MWAGTVPCLLCLPRAWLTASAEQMFIEWMKGQWADLQGYRGCVYGGQGYRQGKAMLRWVPVSGLLCMLV